ncbi:hypothetical protein M1E17_14795 [Arthrobacter sp. D1-29]
MKRILAALGVTGLALLGATAPATASDDTKDGGAKITICHATGSATNPYVPITISLSGLNGHVGHQHSEDIIPANSGSVLPGGQNLHKVDWWNAGCVKPGGAVTPPKGNGDHKITICHATGSASNPFVVITISLNGLNGHAGAGHQNGEDIIPPNSGNIVPGGQNWTAEGQATFNNGCVPVKRPVVPEVVPPAGKTVVPGAVVPRGAAAGQPAGAGAVATNQGFNVQTAVTGSPDTALAPWLGGVVAMLLAAAGVAVHRKLAISAGSGGQRQK